MSRTVVCSGFPPSMKDVYGLRFMRAFYQHCGWDLAMCVEEPAPEFGKRWQRSLWACNGVREFIERHRDIPERNGRRPAGKTERDRRPPIWREKEWQDGYTFRLDAVRFCRQLFIPEHAASTLDDGDILAWFDGDVEVTARTPPDMIEKLCAGFDGAYLGREGRHSEIGFWCIRLSPVTRAFLTALADMYRSDRIFALRETHSAHVWDHVRKSMPQMQMRNLTPGGSGHVFPKSPLAPYLRHDKGQRVKGK